MNLEQKLYLGDGVTSEFRSDTGEFILSTPRIDGEHVIYLDNATLANFMLHVEAVKKYYQALKDEEQRYEDQIINGRSHR